MLEWKNIGVANLPGVISLLAGLLMWVTSLHPVRKHYFELFFYTHQLYVVFVIFLALHVGDFIFSMAAGGIFLFLLDRFLRFWQSRTTVNIISGSCLPCGTLELVLSKPASTTQTSPYLLCEMEQSCAYNNICPSWKLFSHLPACGGFFCSEADCVIWVLIVISMLQICGTMLSVLYSFK